MPGITQNTFAISGGQPVNTNPFIPTSNFYNPPSHATGSGAPLSFPSTSSSSNYYSNPSRPSPPQGVGMVGTNEYAHGTSAFPSLPQSSTGVGYSVPPMAARPFSSIASSQMMTSRSPYGNESGSTFYAPPSSSSQRPAIPLQDPKEGTSREQFQRIKDPESADMFVNIMVNDRLQKGDKSLEEYRCEDYMLRKNGYLHFPKRQQSTPYFYGQSTVPTFSAYNPQPVRGFPPQCF